MEQINSQLAGMPIVLVCSSDATIAFVPTHQFKTIISLASENCQQAIFDMEGFSMGEESYEYRIRYPYKQMGVMREWLIAQQLVSPIEKVIT